MLLVLLLLGGAGCDGGRGGDDDSGPRVVGGWARAPVPGSENGVGYLEVENPGPAGLVIVGARSPTVRAIELHENRVDADGLVRMRRRDRVIVPPGATVAFEPGGLHLMLFGMPRDVETVDVELLRASGEVLAATLEVRTR